MTELEFDVLDELYFVQSFDYLVKEINVDSSSLKHTLGKLLEKGWIKCFHDGVNEVFEDELDFDHNYKKYHYLATKQGLMAHNTDE